MASRDNDQPISTTWRSYVAEAPAWGIVIGALAVSFWTQVHEVSQHGFAMWEALIWGSSTDAGTIACLFLAREGAHRGTPTWGAWALSILCAFLSVQFNVVAGIERGDWLSVEAHVWMPSLALGVWYWLLHGRHRRWTRPGPPPDETTPPSARDPKIERKVRRIVRDDPTISWRKVQEGCPRATRGGRSPQRARHCSRNSKSPTIAPRTNRPSSMRTAPARRAEMAVVIPIPRTPAPHHGDCTDLVAVLDALRTADHRRTRADDAVWRLAQGSRCPQRRYLSAVLEVAHAHMTCREIAGQALRLAFDSDRQPACRRRAHLNHLLHEYEWNNAAMEGIVRFVGSQRTES